MQQTTERAQNPTLQSVSIDCKRSIPSEVELLASTVTDENLSRTLQFMFSEKPGALGAAVKFQAPYVFSKVGKKSIGIFCEIVISLLFYVRKIREIFIHETRKEKLQVKYPISLHMVVLPAQTLKLKSVFQRVFVAVHTA